METWIRRFFSDPVSELQLKALFEDWTGLGADSKEMLAIANDPALLDAELARMRLWYTKTTSNWGKPDAVELIRAMDMELNAPDQEHPYGLLTELFAPGVRVVKINEIRGIEMLERARTTLAN